MIRIFSTTLLLILHCTSLGASTVRTGADHIDQWMKAISGRKTALIVNHTAHLSNGTHLLDTMVALGVDVRVVFAPEHGFRGTADAGEVVANGKDIQTGIPIISLYGKNKKPSAEMLSDVDVVVFDIQDVGTRFYTYISTMLYAMDACADNGKAFVVLDRPNPNDYVDGPVLEEAYKSFVGAMPIPVLHGLTVGELSRMIVGEGWMDCSAMLDLTVVAMAGWRHGEPYSLPAKPSPNLPNDHAIALYPSLCFFEGTCVSVGRGTEFPFEQIGFPDKKGGSYSFTPRPLAGSDKNPMHKDKVCYGDDLRTITAPQGLDLSFMIRMYQNVGDPARFFTQSAFFDKLAGNSQLRTDISQNADEQTIRQHWEPALSEFKTKRQKYLMY